jgi:hypothetical protein
MASHSPRVNTVSQAGTHAAVVAFHMQLVAAEHGAMPAMALHVVGAAVVGTAVVAAAVVGAAVATASMHVAVTIGGLYHVQLSPASHDVSVGRKGHLRMQTAVCAAGHATVHCDICSHGATRLRGAPVTVPQSGPHVAVVAFHMQAAAAEHGTTPVRALHVAGAAVVAGAALVGAALVAS